jgi:hypothetical protein
MAITCGMNSHATTSRTTCERNSSVKMRSANSFADASALPVEMRVGRHERRVEGAFGENRAEMIGQPQRHEERIRHRPGAEDRREHDVAREAGQPRKQRIAADGENTTEHQPLLQHAAALQNGEISLEARRAQP